MLATAFSCDRVCEMDAHARGLVSMMTVCSEGVCSVEAT